MGIRGKNNLIVILGPTASGKTDVAIKLAKQLNGEIISADSRQIYKHMDIGTAKPKKDKNKRLYIVNGIRHHLIDIVEPNKNYNVGIFQKQATEIIKDIQKRNKLPFLVGGTGLYISSITDNIEFPKIKANKKLRKELEAKTIKQLFSIYKKIDKDGSKIIDKNNKRRLIRAIEVVQQTNESFFKNTKKESPFNILQIGIDISKQELEKRISKRVDKMIKQGLEKEVKRLQKYKNNPVLETIGYKEWKQKKENIPERIKINTFKFAKRQLTWFKKDKRIKWLSSYKDIKKEIKSFLKHP